MLWLSFSSYLLILYVVLFYTGCPSLEINMPANDLLYCTMDEGCLGMECCLTLELFDLLEIAVKMFVQIDQKNRTLTLGVNSWRHVVENDLLSGGEAEICDIYFFSQ